MLKRIFWLALVAVSMWLLWRLWRRHEEDFGAVTRQLAPLEPVVPPAPRPAPPPAPVTQPPTPVPAPSAIGAREPPPPPTPQAAPLAEASSPDDQPGRADETLAANAVARREGVVVDDTGADKAATSALGEIVGYCPRCKTKRPISGAHEEITESGRRAARGTCPVCNGNMFTFLPKS